LKEDAKSFSGYACLLGGAVVSWRSRKKTCVATSTTHAEYIAMYEASTEVLWIRLLLRKLNQNFFCKSPTVINVDNQGAVSIVEKNVSDRSKHINVKFHFSREQVAEGQVCFRYVPSHQNIADILTKPLKGPKTKDSATGLGLI
jgi:hypothetical protein